MLKDAGLPLEFWDKAAKTDAYLRNRCEGGPAIDGKRTSLEEAWTGEQLSVDHIRI